MLPSLLRSPSRVTRASARTLFQPLGSAIPCRLSPHVLCRPPPPIVATLYVRINGTKTKGYCEASLKMSLTATMGNKIFQQTLREELVSVSDLSGGVLVVANKCVPARSTRGQNPDQVPHYTSRLFEAASGKYLGGIHSYSTGRQPTFVPEKKHGHRSKWKGSVFPGVISGVFLLK
ncbi:hypothetical protein NLJ89_g11937 [Agrocybe chaxingu]|uniref:Uncharacterized protein n=1 Tax=Agrocybe chaxingu TaxID=84603 RepID=A0A9W8MNY6_9AGAR|nr:hypothetical protein NLJ89_g11937 [Agrocybe chaxingu]